MSRKKNKGTKRESLAKVIISLFVVSLVSLAVIEMTFISTLNYKSSEKDMEKTVEHNIVALETSISDKRNEVDASVTKISGTQALVQAVEQGDVQTIASTEALIMSGSDVEIAITDATGNVLFSSMNSEVEFSDTSLVIKAIGGSYASATEVMDGNIVYVATAPLVDVENGVVGCVIARFNYANNDLLDSVKEQTGAEFTVIVDNMRVATTFEDNGVRQVGTEISTNVYETLQEESVYTGKAKVLGDNYTVIYHSVLDDSGKYLGATFAGLSLVDTQKQIFTSGIGSLGIVVVLLIISIIYFRKTIRNRLKKPVDDVVEVADRICDGNLNVHLEPKYNDEVGTLMIKFNEMTQNLETIIGDVNSYTSELAEGNFTAESEMKDKYVGDYNGILNSLETIEASLKGTLLEIGSVAAEVNSGSDQVSNAAQQLAQGSTEQAASIEDISVNMKAVAEGIAITANKAEEAKSLSEKAGEKVAESNEQMKVMIEAMNDIAEKSDAIEKIIKAIEDIAFQTNILALNAAVEAARAGAAGKGFAVVADEVRNLAQKSAEAVESTTKLIEGTMEAVKRGVQITDQTAVLLEEVGKNTVTVGEKVQDISAATVELTETTNRVAEGISQVSVVVQNNAATSEESAAASIALSDQAVALRELLDKFILD